MNHGDRRTAQLTAQVNDDGSGLSVQETTELAQLHRDSGEDVLNSYAWQQTQEALARAANYHVIRHSAQSQMTDTRQSILA